MSMSLWRKVALREQAKKERGVATRLAGVSRAGQVARSTVPVGESDLPVVETLETVVDTAEVLPGVIESADQAGSDAYDAAIRVYEAQAVADGAAADALAAAQAAAAASAAAAEAEASAAAASAEAAQAAQDATDKSAAAQAAAEAYALAQAQAAEAAAVAEASGDATAKADAARLAAEAAAALDAKAKADAAEARAKADAAEAQATADAAAGAASDAQDAANAVRFLAEGLYQAIPSVTAPTSSPTGPLKQGDMWFVIGAPGSDVAGKFVGVQVWDGAQWVPREMLADSLMVVGPGGIVYVADGKVTADSIAVDALDFKTAQGMSVTAGTFIGGDFYGVMFSGGKFMLPGASSVVVDTPPASSKAVADTYWKNWGTTPPVSVWDAGQSAMALGLGSIPEFLGTIPPMPRGGVIEVTGQHKSVGPDVVDTSLMVNGDQYAARAKVSAVWEPFTLVANVAPRSTGTSLRLAGGSFEGTTYVAGVTVKVTRYDSEALAIEKREDGSVGLSVFGAGGLTEISNERVTLGSPTTTPGNVFALKSQLNAWSPIDGTHAWVSSEGREYVRAGGAWTPLTEGQPVNLTTHLAAAYRGELTGYLRGGMRILNYSASGATGTFEDGSSVPVTSTLPLEWRPPFNANGLVRFVGGRSGSCVATTAGILTINNMTGAFSGSANAQVIWPA